MRVKEHKDACSKRYTRKSAIAQHVQDWQHSMNWEDTKVLDRATRPTQLTVKEALCIQMTPINSRINPHAAVMNYLPAELLP